MKGIPFLIDSFVSSMSSQTHVRKHKRIAATEQKLIALNVDTCEHDRQNTQYFMSVVASLCVFIFPICQFNYNMANFATSATCEELPESRNIMQTNE